MPAEDINDYPIVSGRESDTSDTLGVNVIESCVYGWGHLGKGGAYCAYLEDIT